MAIKNRLSDDIDGSDAVSTIRFGLYGTEYEIDLNAAHAQQLQTALAQYTQHAREISGDTRRSSRLESVYHVLSDRISDNFDLQWRGPTFALTAQSFLLLGFLASTKYHVIQDVLAGLIFIVGVAAALLMARVQCLIAIDQTLLDKYADVLLDKRDPELLLHHAAKTMLRAEKTKYVDVMHGRTKLLLNLTPTPTMLWIITLLALSAAGVYLFVWTLQLQHIL